MKMSMLCPRDTLYRYTIELWIDRAGKEKMKTKAI